MKRIVLIATVTLAGLGLAAVGAAWSPSGEPHRLVQDASQFQTGDLLFVRGTSWRSRVVILFNSGGSDFSHVGLVWRRGDKPFVIHATPNSSDEQGDGAVVMDSLHRFLSNEHVSQAALYRVNDRNRDIAKRAAAVARRYAAQALPFDHNFDASTPGRLYCTEMIWRAYRVADLNLLDEFSASASNPLLPAALSQSHLLNEVARFR